MTPELLCAFCGNLVFLEENRQHYRGHKVDCSFYKEEKERRRQQRGRRLE